MRLIDKYLPSDYSDSASKRIKPAEPLSPDNIFEEMFCNFPEAFARCLTRAARVVPKPFTISSYLAFSM